MLGLKDKIAFGRHRGNAVEDILKRDPGWLRWLREERMKTNKENVFTEQVDKDLKAALKAAKNYETFSKRLTTRDLEAEMLAQKKAAEEAEARAGTGWGEW